MRLQTDKAFRSQSAHAKGSRRPSGIATVDGVRVIVLLPPEGMRGWDSGRRYPHMPPTLTLDRELTSAEADAWWQRVAPAREISLLDELSGKPPTPTT